MGALITTMYTSGSMDPIVSERPLAGIRVLDLSRVLAGPFCARLLADLGAEVIKVEAPGGDDARTYGPFVGGQSTYFRLMNRNKLGVVVDLKQEAGRARLETLLQDADVLVENFRLGVMERLGLAVPQLLERHPRLVVVSITGFGQTGPLRERPAYDLVVQAMSGLLDATGHPGGPGTRTAVSLGDMVPGLYGAFGALAALLERERTGRGQHVDVAMLDGLVSLLEMHAMRTLHAGEKPRRWGNDYPISAPYGTFATSDALVAIAIANDQLFVRFAQALDAERWIGDPRFDTDSQRAAHRDVLRAEIEAVLRDLSAEEVVERLQAVGVPCGPVLDIPTALAHPQTTAREMVIAEADGFATLAPGVKLGADPFPTPTPAPGLGEHDALFPGAVRAE